MIKKTKDKLFFTGKAHQLRIFLTEIVEKNPKNTTIKEFLQKPILK
ncbi:hypothetical protein [Alkaliphilus transvaalensis]|nr:hypothetical protein [Alkaliphilus transvaalensis]